MDRSNRQTFLVIFLAATVAAATVAAAQTTTVTNSNDGTSGTIPVYTGSATLGNSWIAFSDGKMTAAAGGATNQLYQIGIAVNGTYPVDAFGYYWNGGYFQPYFDYEFAPLFFTTGMTATGGSGKTVMTLGTDGKVGIGTTYPTTALQVAGTVTASSFSGDSSGLTGTASNLSVGGTASTITGNVAMSQVTGLNSALTGIA